MKKQIVIESTMHINNKKYDYALEKVDDNTTFVRCDAANICQPFDNENLPELIFHLPEYIIEAQDEVASDFIQFRVSGAEKKQILKNALKNGYNNVSSFLRDRSLGEN